MGSYQMVVTFSHLGESWELPHYLLGPNDQYATEQTERWFKSQYPQYPIESIEIKSRMYRASKKV